MKLFARLLLATNALLFAQASVQAAEPLKATLTLHADRPQWIIDRNIYGQFAEHLGSGVYGGIWVGENSPIPNTRGIRNDVVAALKKLNIPSVRWPGGCFADTYHWRDGIGPRAQRGVSVNNTWGGVIDDNAFGTHEFMDLVEQLGAQAYISGNLGSGTPQEMRDWIEYMTSNADSSLARLRRQNGRDKPWSIGFFGIGNESWGCGGEMRAPYYVDEYRRYNMFVTQASNAFKTIAVGPNDADYAWTETLMRDAGKNMTGLSLHYYTIPSGDWKRKGSATQFNENEWAWTMKRTLKMEELLQKHGAIMDKYDPDQKVGLMVDEWGLWFDTEPDANPGFLYQQNTLRDAVLAAINLNIFHAHGDRVKMAAIAQMVNVLQAMILTDHEKMLLTPTYHIFEMYKVHKGATFLPLDVQAPSYQSGDVTLPMLSVSASRDAAGKVHVSLVNLDPNRELTIATQLDGVKPQRVTGRILTAAAMNAHNTFDQPQAVQPQKFTGATLKGAQLALRLPPKSVVTLELE